MFLPLLALLLLLVPQFESTQNISCHRGRWLCQEDYRRINEPPPKQSHCNLTRPVQCNGGDTFKEIVDSAEEQALLGIQCSWIKRDYGIHQMSPRYRCLFEPSYNRSVHPTAAWCPWSFWTGWSFVCRDRAAVGTRISDDATGAVLSTRSRKCRCPPSPGECPTGETTERRWLPVEQQSSEPGSCSWCSWGQWTSDCACSSLATLTRARNRACACSNGTLLQPRPFAESKIRWSLVYENFPCSGSSRDFDICSKCYGRPSEPEPEPEPESPDDDSTNGFQSPGSGSNKDGRMLITLLALSMLTMVLVVYCVKKCDNRRASNTNESVAVHLVAISAALSVPRQPPPQQPPPLQASQPLLPSPSQPPECSTPPPSYDEAIRYAV